jgi:heterodisulfide reductase subunit A-like polyferredoxin
MKQEHVETDLTVIGGGLAGVCAAVAAARLGKTVALVQNRPVLGGNSSSEVRVWVCDVFQHFHAHNSIISTLVFGLKAMGRSTTLRKAESVSVSPTPTLPARLSPWVST